MIEMVDNVIIKRKLEDYKRSLYPLPLYIAPLYEIKTDLHSMLLSTTARHRKHIKQQEWQSDL